MSFFARATRPLAPLDGPVNRLGDLAVRVTPWIWWPAAPPRPERPYDAGQHAVYLAWSVAGYVAADLLAQRMPEEQRPSGRRLRNERIVTAVLSVILWLVSAGAWDRRAARLRRRPWARLRR